VFDDMLKKPCPYHKTPVNHTLKQCDMLKKYYSRAAAKDGEGEKGLPLYQLLKKHERFSWTVEAQEALDKLKSTLAHAPILTPPQGSEPLYLYVTTTTLVVSAVIVVERTEEGHSLSVQRLMYYISEVLSETKA
jgi:hypothetical protein